MFVKTLKQSVRWMAVNLACATMVFSPVASGRETESLNAKKIQMHLQELGLDGKKITLGEFWEKTKIYYPGFVYKDLEKFVSENKTMLMPEFTVTNAKATDGSMVPVLQVSAGGKNTTIQIFGEKNKWAKYNGIVLSEQDLQSVGDAFKRIEASDARLRREADRYRAEKTKATQRESAQNTSQMTKDFARFKGFPRMSPAQWKQMTPEQRAQFIVSMRLLWKDARQVLRLDEIANSSKKPASKGRKFSSFEEFLKVVLGDDAEAADAKKPARRSAGRVISQEPSGGSATAPADTADVDAAEKLAKIGFTRQSISDPYGNKCIVLGYVSSEGNGMNYGKREHRVCSIENVFETNKYKSANTPLAKMVQDAQAYCQKQSPNYFACNPAVYSYNNEGNAICADRTKQLPDDPPVGNIQKATWWDGPCDKASKLTSQKIQDGMKASDSKYAESDKRYDEKGQLKADVAQAQIERIEQDQMKNDAFKQTRVFLENALKSKGKDLGGLLDPKKLWDKDDDAMLVEIQNQFESEIGAAIQSCEKSVARKKNLDKNQKGACDQLHHRWLFTERIISQYRAKSCLGGSTYIWKLDDKKLSKNQSALTLKNKSQITDKDLTCQCSNSDKKIKFNDDTGCGISIVSPPPVVCVPATSADVTTCSPAPSETSDKCDKPQGIADFDYQKCECTKGELVNESESKNSFLSENFSNFPQQETKASKWVCKDSNYLPWILGGLGVLGLAGLFYKIFHKNKNSPKTPPTPPVPPVCSLTCTGNTVLNAAACRCDVKPPEQSCAPKSGTYPNCTCSPVNTCVTGQQVYNMLTCQCDDVPQTVTCADGSQAQNTAACPKCADGSYRTQPTPGRPGGCPASSEGGAGSSTCANPPCSGGVPTAH